MKERIRYWKIRMWFVREVFVMCLKFLMGYYEPERTPEFKALLKETIIFAWNGEMGPLLLAGIKGDMWKK